jgi:protein SCO1/2
MTSRLPLPSAAHIAILLAAAALALAGCGQAKAPQGDAAGGAAFTISGGPKSDFHATEVKGIDYGRGLVLKDASGTPRRLEDFKDSVTLVFFGFASCPDVCPTTLMRLQEVRKAMGADGERVRVVFVTLDPERDTPERLAAYVTQFDPSFVGLRPEPGQMSAVQESFKVVAVKMPVPDTDTYMLDHSAVIYVYDRSNALRLIASPDFKVPELAADLARLARG